MISNHTYGIQDEKAPAWGVTTWFNLPDGKQALDRHDFDGKLLVVYCFQSWCPGCHSHGFPTLQALKAAYEDRPDIAFVAIQTVFEGFEANTLARAKAIARQYQLDIPFGHDPGPDGQRSLVMQRYRTGGTPWTILIDRNGIVRFNDFHVDLDQMKYWIEGLSHQ